MCLLKRVLPFALALTIGVVLWAVFSQASRTTGGCSQSMQGKIPTTPPVQSPMLPTAGINIDPTLYRNLPDDRFGDPRSKSTATSAGNGTGVGIDPGSNYDRYDNRVFNPKDVTQKARVLSRAEPQYTEEARKNQVSGTVVLRAVFSSNGQVTNIRPVSNLPYGLTEKAIAAARMIKFTPAMKDGHPVSQYIQIEYSFNLY
jgi:TonB family protein